MKLQLVERSLKNLLMHLEIPLNRRLGREHIPADKETFCIEPSSACNLRCRFCAYEKKSSPRVNMSQSMFTSCVDEALDIGYKEFHLTPCTGDVFMDPHIFDKFAYLEECKGVRAYHFFTNLTIIGTDKIERLLKLKKLSRMVVSVYGHDEETFVTLTQSSSKIYRRLLANLETLLAHRADWPFKLSIGFRSTFDVPRNDASDLLRLLRRLRDAGVRVNSSRGLYNNWGGYVKQDDVRDLNIKIISAERVYKSGACVKLFDSFQVTASGIVNGCSCRDVDTTLKIGDLNEMPLRSILSRTNTAYMKVIEEQQSGRFPPVCRACDYYRSIYHQPSDFRKNKIPTQTIAAFLKKLEEQ